MAKGRWRPRRWWTAFSGLGVLLGLGIFAGVSQADSPANYGTISNHIRASRGLVGVDAIANAPCPAWGIVPGANVQAEESVLTSASAVSADDAWAVGSIKSSGVWRTLTEHWDGKAWTVVSSPNPTEGDNYLDGVAAISANNVWAMGESGPSTRPQTIILHWDGTAWTPARLPQLEPSGNRLFSVSAVSANDVWAVGMAGNRNSIAQAIIMHFNGVDWSVVPNVTYGYDDILYGVSALSSNDVWAVGDAARDRAIDTVVKHWNGTEWLNINRPSEGGAWSTLNAVAAISPADVWAVGRSCQRFSCILHDILIEHWNGNSVVQVDSPRVTADRSELLGVAAVSANDVWAVGYWESGNAPRRTLMMHWDGTAWTRVGPPDTGDAADRFEGIVKVPGGDLLAVGSVGPVGSRRALIERYTDQCAPPPPPPTPVPTATNTPVLATPTPSAVPTLPATPLPGSGSRTFPETGKTVSGLFLDYWDNHGGLPQQGFPISQLFGEVSDLNGKPYTVQYFERAVFEYHPENQAPFNVLLSQLGTFQYKKKYPGGAPGQQPNTTPGSVLFPETGKRLGHRFLQYWQQNGGLPQQGYPISDEFTEVSDLNGKPYLVQYFERAVFELHPENQPPYDVLLSQLGTFQYKKKYGPR